MSHFEITASPRLKNYISVNCHPREKAKKTKLVNFIDLQPLCENASIFTYFK